MLFQNKKLYCAIKSFFFIYYIYDASLRCVSKHLDLYKHPGSYGCVIFFILPSFGELRFPKSLLAIRIWDSFPELEEVLCQPSSRCRVASPLPASRFPSLGVIWEMTCAIWRPSRCCPGVLPNYPFERPLMYALKTLSFVHHKGTKARSKAIKNIGIPWVCRGFNRPSLPVLSVLLHLTLVPCCSLQWLLSHALKLLELQRHAEYCS